MQRQVTFGEAIQRGFQQYATFYGRASRSEFWWWTLFTCLVGAAFGIIGSDVLKSLGYLALLLPNVAIAVRRMHDTGRSGWWVLISLIPVVGIIVFIVFAAEESKGANQYGDVPNMIY
jgi:uncharacterized membrane protein YhaH (DUF805 family)